MPNTMKGNRATTSLRDAGAASNMHAISMPRNMCSGRSPTNIAVTASQSTIDSTSTRVSPAEGKPKILFPLIWKDLYGTHPHAANAVRLAKTAITAMATMRMMKAVSP